MKATHVVFVVAATVFVVVTGAATGAGGLAHADHGSLNSHAFDLSGALDREVAPTHRSLEVAVGAGYTQGVGGAGRVGDVQDLTGPGGDVELQVAFRATPRFSVGLYGTLARFRHGDAIVDGSRAHGATTGIHAVWHARQSRALDPWISIGAGWRALWLSPKDTEGSSLHGIELPRVQLGIDYRFTPWLAIAPVIGASASLFLYEDAMATELTKVRENRLNLYGFAGVLGRFDIGG